MSGPSCLKEAYILVGVTGYPQNVVGGTSQNQENKGVVKAGTLGWVSREGFLEKVGFDLALKQDVRLQQPSDSGLAGARWNVEAGNQSFGLCSLETGLAWQRGTVSGRTSCAEARALEARTKNKPSCQARYLCEQHNTVSCQLPVYSLEIHQYIYPVEQIRRVIPNLDP